MDNLGLQTVLSVIVLIVISLANRNTALHVGSPGRETCITSTDGRTTEIPAILPEHADRAMCESQTSCGARALRSSGLPH